MDVTRKPSVWDWVCYKHNAHLMTMFGRAKCIRDPECVQLDNDQVKWVAAQPGSPHYINMDGHWLEHLLSVPGPHEPSDDEECAQHGMERSSPTLWWHLYAHEEIDGDIEVGESSVAALTQTPLIRSLSLLGPVYAHAEQWVAPDGLTPRNGLLTQTFHGERMLPYVRSFQHRPTTLEVRLAVTESAYRHAVHQQSAASNGSRTSKVESEERKLLDEH